MKDKKFENIVIRNMCEADMFYLKKWLLDPVVLGWFPMTNALEVEDALKNWQIYARLGSAFTAEVDGKPAGAINLYINQYEKIKHQSLFAILVGEEYRGKGVGTKLLEFLMKVAKEKFGITLLHLEVYEGNPAYRLYKRLGFKEYGVHKKFLKEKDGSYHSKVLMQKEL
jgi:RimJ/RimL family protein N-acetyltransferase